MPACRSTPGEGVGLLRSPRIRAQVAPPWSGFDRQQSPASVMQLSSAWESFLANCAGGHVAGMTHVKERAVQMQGSNTKTICIGCAVPRSDQYLAAAHLVRFGKAVKFQCELRCVGTDRIFRETPPRRCDPQHATDGRYKLSHICF